MMFSIVPGTFGTPCIYICVSNRPFSDLSISTAQSARKSSRILNNWKPQSSICFSIPLFTLESILSQNGSN